MNCSEFEDIVNDIARAGPKDTVADPARASGLAHVEDCARCATRLADERALSAGLKSLAAREEGKTAPRALESVLLDAFRAQSAPPTQPNAPFARRRSWTWPRIV